MKGELSAPAAYDELDGSGPLLCLGRALPYIDKGSMPCGRELDATGRSFNPDSGLSVRGRPLNHEPSASASAVREGLSGTSFPLLDGESIPELGIGVDGRSKGSASVLESTGISD